MKSKILLISLVLVAIGIAGCNSITRSIIQYRQNWTVEIDTTFRPANQVYDNVFIGLNVVDKKEDKFTYAFTVTYLPFLAKEYVTEPMEFSIPFYDDYTVLAVKFNNQSEWDLTLSGYQYLYFTPSGQDVPALSQGDFRRMTRLPLAFENLFGAIMSRFPKTNRSNLQNQMWAAFRDITSRLPLINTDRKLFAGRSTEDFLLFPVAPLSTVDGHFSINEITADAGNRSVARSQKTEKYEFKTSKKVTYQKVCLNNLDKRDWYWCDITEQEYNEKRNNPDKYWYNDTTKVWISGEPPEEE